MIYDTSIINKLSGDTQLIINNIMGRVRIRSRCRFCLEVSVRVRFSV